VATTFNWIYLGTGALIDPTEGNFTAENASALVGQTYGSGAGPVYDRISQVTMINNGGEATALDQNNTASNDQFQTNIGAGLQTFTFDASCIYNATVTYADGTTGTITAVIAQDTAGRLFLAPETATAPAPDTAVLEARPIVSITLNSISGGVIDYLGLGTDRTVTGFDNGWVDGTAGNDLINGAFIEPIANGSDRIDTNDGINASSLNDDRIRAGAGNDTVLAGIGNDSALGGTGNDSLSGEAGLDTILGEDGDDRLFGGAGNDQLFGGIGNDSLEGGTENDQLFGEAGIDSLYGGDGADSLDGGTEADVLFGGAGIDTLVGGDGNDSLDGGTENDQLFGGSGDDTLRGDAGADSLDGGIGNDQLFGGAGIDSLYGGDGADSLDGGTENDVLFGGAGIDSLYGGDGADSLDGGTENDQLFGGSGDDTLRGDAGADSLDGGIGNDQLFGGLGSDTLIGGDGADQLDGGDAGDSILGGSGADLIYGGDGADTIQFGSDDDTVYGGAGDDLIDDANGSLLPGNNLLSGGSGNDTVWAGLGNDQLFGDEGNDLLYGEDGDDGLYGGIGTDILDGGVGNDLLQGGDGVDTLYGGAGRDLLIGGAGIDQIFGGGDQDTIYGDIGDVVDGGSTGTDEDVLDLTAWGKELTNVYKDPLNPENGYVEFLDSLGNVIGTMTFSDIETIIPCFTPGTLIVTARGEVSVEDLRPGDMVATRDGGVQRIRWIGRKALSLAHLVVNPALRPVFIPAGALGHGMPARDMRVSPQHRILLEGPRAEMLFGEPEVLVAAIHLVGHCGIRQELSLGVDYIHLMFDAHEILCSDGIWSESFQPASRMVGSMDRAQQDEIMALFPDLAESVVAFPSARLTLKAHEARVLLAA
jgi:Ca2+-binding RTX toxin-like protein